MLTYTQCNLKDWRILIVLSLMGWLQQQPFLSDFIDRAWCQLCLSQDQAMTLPFAKGKQQRHMPNFDSFLIGFSSCTILAKATLNFSIFSPWHCGSCNFNIIMVACSVCKHETSYRSISCQVSICNRNLDCHVPAKEDTIPGWIDEKQVCDSEQTRMSQEVADMHFEMRCASLGFHVYMSIWRPRIEENFRMKPEYANVYDPLAIAITASLQETLTGYDVVGHVPRKVSRFCRYSLNYGVLP